MLFCLNSQDNTPGNTDMHNLTPGIGIPCLEQFAERMQSSRCHMKIDRVMHLIWVLYSISPTIFIHIPFPHKYYGTVLTQNQDIKNYFLLSCRMLLMWITWVACTLDGQHFCNWTLTCMDLNILVHFHDLHALHHCNQIWESWTCM